MPTCDPIILTPAARAIISIKPKSVLEIGVGIGKWGVLVREYAEMWADHRFYKGEWQADIVGIEIHEGYRNPVWDVYNRVIVGNALDLAKTMDWDGSRFDLGIMIDVIEHIEKSQAAEYLAWLMTKCEKLLISYSNHDQQGVRDNKYEDHISKWAPEDFAAYHPTMLAGNEAEGWGLYLLSV